MQEQFYSVFVVCSYLASYNKLRFTIEDVRLLFFTRRVSHGYSELEYTLVAQPAGRAASLGGPKHHELPLGFLAAPLHLFIGQSQGARHHYSVAARISKIASSVATI